MLPTSIFALPSPALSADDAILLGQSCALEGPLSGINREAMAGASWYLKRINESGGVHGRPVRVVTLDDAYDAERTAENARTLVAKHNAVALFNIAGTPTNLAAVPVAKELKVPLVAPFTGTDLLRRKHERYVFNCRAGFADELSKIVEHLTTIGIGDAGVVYLDNAFGVDGVTSLTQSAKSRGLTIKAKAVVDVKGTTLKQAAATLAEHSPRAVILILPGALPADFITEYRQRGRQTLFYALSVVSPAQLIQKLGEAAIGVAIAQVLPSATSSSSALGREIQSVAQSQGFTGTLTQNHLEGFVAAKVVVEGLRRAGRSATSEGLVLGLESLSDFDLGGYRVRFSNANHNGSTFVDISVIGRDNRLVR